jgi:hypothetical protein
MKYFKVRKYVIEEFKVQAMTAKEARSKCPDDPSKVTVTKITVTLNK